MSTPTSSRTRRDWFVDACVFLSALVMGLFMYLDRLDDPTVPGWLLVVDQITGALGCVALWWRRRWPVALSLAFIPVSAYSELVAGAQAAALFTVAIYRPVRVTLAIGLLSLVSVPVYTLVRPDPGVPPFFVVLLGLVVTIAVVGWGLFIRHRRQLVLSLRERAVRAETEARLRAEHAQHLAREEIAREMHDVLGHRLSLLSVHAGALEYRPDAPAEEIARAAKVIRESAHQALQDLREVIGVLRAPVGELPQPTLADVHDLVTESVRAGTPVTLDVARADGVPANAGRTAYRIVQEGLTNARKHAVGAEVAVAVRGAPGEGVTVEIRNAAPVTMTDRATTPHGSGQGLIGLAERVSLSGGRLEHHPTTDGGFVLSAWLPWPA